jgi:GGDEF domain-containing protein
LRCEGYELFLSPSIGIAHGRDESGSSELLLEDAVLAMRTSRERRRAGFQFFHARMRGAPSGRFTN